MIIDYHLRVLYTYLSLLLNFFESSESKPYEHK